MFRIVSLLVAVFAGVGVILWLPPRAAGNFLFYWFTLNITLFVLIYGARTLWWRSLHGKALMWMTSSLAIIGLQGTAGLLWPGYPLRLSIRQGLFLLLVIATLNLLLAFMKIRAESSKDPRAPQD